MGLWKLVLFIHLSLFILFLRLWRVSVNSKISVLVICNFWAMIGIAFIYRNHIQSRKDFACSCRL